MRKLYNLYPSNLQTQFPSFSIIRFSRTKSDLGAMLIINWDGNHTSFPTPFLRLRGRVARPYAAARCPPLKPLSQRSGFPKCNIRASSFAKVLAYSWTLRYRIRASTIKAFEGSSEDRRASLNIPYSGLVIRLNRRLVDNHGLLWKAEQRLHHLPYTSN